MIEIYGETCFFYASTLGPCLLFALPSQLNRENSRVKEQLRHDQWSSKLLVEELKKELTMKTTRLTLLEAEKQTLREDMVSWYFDNGDEVLFLRSPQQY